MPPKIGRRVKGKGQQGGGEEKGSDDVRRVTKYDVLYQRAVVERLVSGTYKYKEEFSDDEGDYKWETGRPYIVQPVDLANVEQKGESVNGKLPSRFRKPHKFPGQASLAHPLARGLHPREIAAKENEEAKFDFAIPLPTINSAGRTTLGIYCLKLIWR